MADTLGNKRDYSSPVSDWIIDAMPVWLLPAPILYSVRTVGTFRSGPGFAFHESCIVVFDFGESSRALMLDFKYRCTRTKALLRRCMGYALSTMVFFAIYGSAASISFANAVGEMAPQPGCPMGTVAISNACTPENAIASNKKRNLLAPLMRLAQACPTGFAACGGGACTTNTTNDPFNCGSCGNVCPGSQVCTASVCTAPPPKNVLWVSPGGSDASACSQTAPCATFQGAINKGNVVQINCLGSGNYGTVTITASITIDCGAGNIGNIVSSATTGITINTSAAATIILRHLTLNGLNANANPIYGINASSFVSGTLIVEDCMIEGYTLFGIFFTPTGGRGLLQVSNSQIFGNATGILVAPPSGQIASVTLSKVELVGNSVDGLGLAGSGVIAGTMRESVVAANQTSGVVANAGQVFFTVEESSIVDNLTYGIQTNSAGSVVNVGASTIGGNGTGVKATLGSLISFGNNQMSANASNGTFTSAAPRQ